MDFKQLSIPLQKNASADPIKIWRSLPRLEGAPNDLWTGQGYALNEWHQHRGDNDILISLNTGAGKTVVGLLIAQSLVNEGLENVVYACPTNDLVIQTQRQARAIGIDATTRMEGAFDNSRFEDGQSFCITNYAAVLNGLSVFRSRFRPEAVIFDDAHVSESMIRDAFTISIAHSQEAEIYSKIASIFVEEFRNLNREGKFLDSVSPQKDPAEIIIIPPDAVMRHRDEIEAIFRAPAISNGKSHKFAYHHLRDNLHICAFIFRKGVLEVSPPFLPTLTLPLFGSDTRRIYLSATLSNQADIVRAFGRSPKRHIAPENDAGNGERLVLTERLLSFNRRIGLDFVAELAKKTKVLIATNSYSEARKWQAIAVPPPKETFTASLDVFRNSTSGAFVLVSRVDGIDLPNDTCRIMVIDGVPVGNSLIDRYLSEGLGIGNFTASRSASRLVQLFGRINRGRSDYGAYIIVGNDLNSWVSRDRHVARLPKLLRAQLLLGRHVQEGIPVKNLEQMSDIIDKVVIDKPRDRDWLEFYSGYIDSMEIDEDTSERAAETERRNLASALAEADAANRAWQGQYLEAANVLENVVTDVSRSDSMFAGWLNLWIGAYHYANGSKEEAVEHFGRARYQTGNALIVGTVLPENTTETNEPVTSSLLSMYRLCAGSRESFNKRIRQLEEAVVSLRGGSSNQAEEAVRQLGQSLGYISTRPDNDHDIGPDVLWVDDKSPQIGIGFELKTDKGADSTYSKDDIGQCLNHLEWMKSDAGLQVQGLILVGPYCSVSGSASPSPEVFISPLSKFAELAEVYLGLLRQCHEQPSSERSVWLVRNVGDRFDLSNMRSALECRAANGPA